MSGWPDRQPTEEEAREALRTGNYPKCANALMKEINTVNPKIIDTLRTQRDSAANQIVNLEAMLDRPDDPEDLQQFRRELLPAVRRELANIQEALDAAEELLPTTPAKLQTEQRPWVLHNFGPGQPHQPLLGMVEEIGELLENIDTWNVAEIKDALADATVFAADYATKKGWDFGKIFPLAENLGGIQVMPPPSRDLQVELRWAVRQVAKVAHHQLKSEQNIRGSKAKHEEEGARALQQFLVQLEGLAGHFGWALMEITGPVWARVRKRDFKKNALTGGEGAAPVQAPPRVYIASKLENADAVRVMRDRLQAAGFTITYDWTVHGSVRDAGDARMAEVAGLELNGVVTADVVVVLLPGGRGTHTELGAAIALGKPVVVHTTDPSHFTQGTNTCLFYWHKLVRRVATVDEVPAAARAALSR